MGKNQLSNGTEQFEEQIARKAYELFEQRGREAGHEVDDWLEAERMVTNEIEQSKTRHRSGDRSTTRRSPYFDQ
jgi:hypothetical protein